MPKHQRHLPQAYQDLLQDILLGARSFQAAQRTLQTMGLSYSPQQTEQLLQQLHQEARGFFSRPLAPDWFALFADAKVINLKDDQDHVRQAVHFLVLGIDLEGRKQLLGATTFWGNEVLEAWRRVLLDLKNRGLTRTLLWVTDDFSGLNRLLQGLFPNSYHQLCTVHLLRNAQRYLSSQDYATFKELWRELARASSPESAWAKLRSLLEQLRPTNKAWVEHLEPRAPITWPFCTSQPVCAPACAPPTCPKASTTRSKTSAAMPAATSTPNGKPSSKSNSSPTSSTKPSGAAPTLPSKPNWLA